MPLCDGHQNLTRIERTAFIMERPTPSKSRSSQENAIPYFPNRTLAQTTAYSRHSHCPPAGDILEILQENCRPLTPFPCFPSQDLPPFSGFMISIPLVISGLRSSISTYPFPSYLLPLHPTKELSSTDGNHRMSSGWGCSTWVQILVMTVIYDREIDL